MTDTRNITVRVLLSMDFRSTCMDYDAEVPYEEVAELPIRATDELAACEVAYAICNSYPGELHCPAEYADAVEAYRSQQHRSLSVGDAVIIGEVTFAVQSCGFGPVAAPVNLDRLSSSGPTTDAVVAS